MAAQEDSDAALAAAKEIRFSWIAAIGRWVSMYKGVAVIVTAAGALAGRFATSEIVQGAGYGILVTCIVYWLADKCVQIREQWREEALIPILRQKRASVKAEQSRRRDAFVAKYWDRAYAVLQGDPDSATRQFHADIDRLLETPDDPPLSS
jgi:hypothetical protein